MSAFRLLLRRGALLAFFVLAACDPGPSIGATGTVVNTAGTGLGAVAVTLRGQEPGGQPFNIDAAFTDSSGHYEVGRTSYRGPLPVELSLELARDGFVTATVPLGTLNSTSPFTRDGLATTLEISP